MRPALFPSERSVRAATAAATAAAPVVSAGVVETDADERLPYALVDVRRVMHQTVELLVLLGELPVAEASSSSSSNNNNNNNNSIVQQRALTLKVSADGFRANYRVGRVIVTLTLLDATRAHSALATIPVLLATGGESGDTMDALLTLLHQSVSALRNDGLHVTIDDASAHFAVARVLVCADQKALALLCGITTARHKHFCCWCVITKQQRTDLLVTADLRTLASTRSSSSSLPQGAAAAARAARDTTHGVERASALLSDDTFVESMLDVVPDPLHLRMRMWERYLCVYRAQLTTDQAVAALLTRLRDCGVHNDFAFVENTKPGASCAFRCSLTGRQCDKLIAKFDAIFIRPPPPASLIQPAQRAANEQRMLALLAVGNALAAVDSHALSSSPSSFSLDTALSSLSRLKDALLRYDAHAPLVNNSMHVTLFHLAT